MELDGGGSFGCLGAHPPAAPPLIARPPAPFFLALRVDGDHPVVLHPSSHLRLHAGQLGGEDARRDAGVEVRFKLQKLPHEVEVGRDDGPAALDVLVGVAHGHQGVLHQVGDDNGGRTGDAGLAVDKDSLATLVGLLWSWGEKTAGSGTARSTSVACRTCEGHWKKEGA